MGPQLPNARAFNHQERVQHLRERKKSVLIYSKAPPLPSPSLQSVTFNLQKKLQDNHVGQQIETPYPAFFPNQSAKVQYYLFQY